MGMFHLLENDVRIYSIILKRFCIDLTYILKKCRSSKYPKWLTSLRLCWTITSNVQRSSRDWLRQCKKSKQNIEHFIFKKFHTKIYAFRREEAAQRPKSEFVPKTLSDLVVECEGGAYMFMI